MFKNIGTRFVEVSPEIVCNEPLLKIFSLQVFGIFKGTQCRSGPDALNTYDKDGKATTCNGNVGSYEAYSVYMFDDVKAPPVTKTQIVSPPTGGVVPGGYSFTLLCGTTGYPEPTVLWTKDGEELPDDVNFRVRGLYFTVYLIVCYNGYFTIRTKC